MLVHSNARKNEKTKKRGQNFKTGFDEKKKELRKTNGGFSSADHSVGSLTELAFLGGKIARISVPPISFFLKKKIMKNKKRKPKAACSFSC